jgi:hypothetical protein
MGRCSPAILVEDQPEWEFRGGFFFVTWNEKTWCYPPHAFFKMFAAMGEVARQYNFAGAEVIPFPKVDAGGH